MHEDCFSRSTSRVMAISLTISLVTACQDSPTDPGPDMARPSLAVASNQWTTRKNLPNTERLGLTSAVVPNASGQSVLYVIGGSSSLNPQPSGPTSGALSRVQAYNVATNTWTSRASLPLDLYKTNGAGVINGKIYVSGGRRSGDKRYEQALLVYDPVANTWTRKADMPFKTWGGITGVINNQLYVLTCEGEEDCWQFDREDLYRYDPPTDTWSFLSTTPIPLGMPMGGTMGKKLYALGGPNGDFLVYDPVTRAWTTKAPIPGGRRWGAAYATLAGKLYIFGGFEGGPQDPPGGTPISKTSVYDPATNKWTTKKQLPTARFDITAFRVVVNGQPRIEVVGGARPGNNLQYVP